MCLLFLQSTMEALVLLSIPRMTSTLVQLWNDSEIQLLVLLSFTMQLFLLFFGGLRRRNANMLLRFPLWLAYLLADSIAVYTLGLISRHSSCAPSDHGSISQLAFLWVPFLLVHLGGQDTITAFSIEDNALWLRHLITLLVQVFIALYVIWKSIPCNRFLALSILMFVVGTIKYGERTWALKCASKQAPLKSVPSLADRWLFDVNMPYSDIVNFAVHKIQVVKYLFAGQVHFTHPVQRNEQEMHIKFKMIEIQLALMYDDLYTKAGVVFHHWPIAIFRVFAHASTVVAFMLFLLRSRNNNKEIRYNPADVAVTYTLFVGAVSLEICSIFAVILLSPRTWVFLEAKGPYFSSLSRAAWSLLEFVRPATRPWWSDSLGQYDLVSSSFPDLRPELVLVTRIMGLVGAEDLWRKFLHTKHVECPTEVKRLIVQMANGLFSTGLGKEVPISLSFLAKTDFVNLVTQLHIFTSLCLHSDTTDCDRKKACEVLSNYMLYLLLVHPSFLSAVIIRGDPNFKLAKISEEMRRDCHSSEAFYKAIPSRLASGFEAVKLLHEDFHTAGPPWEALADIWVRVLFYAAGKTRAVAHSKQLSEGGELLTFVWLLMAQLSIGDSGFIPFELVTPPAYQRILPVIDKLYAFRPENEENYPRHSDV